MADRLLDLVTRELTPALHALVHRYGIPSGATVAQQRQAREELYAALVEAYLLGQREGIRGAREAVVKALDAGIERLVEDDRETMPAPEPDAGGAR